jgi:hypothetical protein
MKKIIFNLIFFLSISLLFKMSLGKDVCTNTLTLKILEVSYSGTITVEISNLSREPIKIFEESNSWGAFCWRILRIRKDCIESFFQIPNEIFTRNIPTYGEISVGTHIKKKLNLHDGTWGDMRCKIELGGGMKSKIENFKPNDVIIAIYEVPYSYEAYNLKVWYGMIAAFKKL